MSVARFDDEVEAEFDDFCTPRFGPPTRRVALGMEVSIAVNSYHYGDRSRMGAAWAMVESHLRGGYDPGEVLDPVRLLLSVFSCHTSRVVLELLTPYLVEKGLIR